MFVCFIDKTRAVKPLGRSHSRILSFTQDGPAFSTKTAQRVLQVAKVGNLQVDEVALLSRSAEHADLTRDAKPHTKRPLTHLIGLPVSILKTALDTSALGGFEPNSQGETGVGIQRVIH